MSRSRGVAIVFPVCGIVLSILGHAAQVSRADAGSKTWVGRYQEIEDYLRTAECLTMEQLAATALTRCVLRPGGLVSRMSWRTRPPGTYRGFWESYKADIAAYEIDKLLHLDMVPPVVERHLHGNTGAATMWVERTRPWKDAQRDAVPVSFERQLDRMKMFDNLIGNSDRNAMNMLVDAEWNLVLLDHNRAFRSGAELPHRITRVDEELLAAMKALSRKQLDTVLRPWLTDTEIAAILERRDRMTVRQGVKER